METAKPTSALSVLGLAAALIAGCGGGSSRNVIQNKGSDTLVNVAQAWAEEYAALRPGTAVAVTGGGSGTGIAAMINGTVDVANSSRKMKDSEIELARGNGNEPIEFVVGYDALAVYVHPDNPMDEISLEQLAALYGEGGDIDTWSQYGVEVPGCSSDEVVRVSRQNNSGTYVYFREAVLGDQRDFKLGSRDMHGSKDVVDLVENTPCAIGYSGLAYATDHIKMPCVQGRARTASAYLLRSRPRSTSSYPDRPSPVDVHRRRARGRHPRVHRLGVERRGPVHHLREGLRAARRRELFLSGNRASGNDAA